MNREGVKGRNDLIYWKKKLQLEICLYHWTDWANKVNPLLQYVRWINDHKPFFDESYLLCSAFCAAVLGATFLQW